MRAHDFLPSPLAMLILRAYTYKGMVKSVSQKGKLVILAYHVTLSSYSKKVYFKRRVLKR